MRPMQCALDDLRSVGLTIEEMKQMTECGELVARWAGYDIRHWPETRVVKASGGREVGISYPPSR